MTWRGTTSTRDRIFASLPYLLTLLYGLPFGQSLLKMFPVLEKILFPLFFPVAVIYSSIPLAGIVIFFALILLVVRNERISHFIRFNTMQALLISISLFLCSILISFLGEISFGQQLIIQVLNNAIFLTFLAAFGYSIVQSLRGRYAELPKISDAAYTQVR